MTLAEIFRHLKTIRTAGVALDACEKAIGIAQTYVDEGLAYSPLSFMTALAGVQRYSQQLAQLPSDSPIAFEYDTVARLYIEISGQDGARERLDRLSFVDELVDSAKENLPKILPSLADQVAEIFKRLWPVVIVVAIVVIASVFVKAKVTA